MKEIQKKPVYKLTLAAIFVALATALSFIKIYKLPLGGSVTLLSMLPIVLLPSILGFKWGIGSAFVYSLIQLFFGIAFDGLFAWGLSPLALIGTIFLDYILAFTVLGLSGIFAKKGYLAQVLGCGAVICARLLCHFISGYIIFANFEQFEIFGKTVMNSPALYSICYNGTYMLPELVLTIVAAVVLFKIPAIKRLMVLSD
ncbi:MAG: energy-coupled thiamine transporter ThiT [Clostridia bacterium]|nr:energy-coupled thiamine transporter ThiT [Clostridia bacterium]